jgi:hypothetical protein
MQMKTSTGVMLDSDQGCAARCSRYAKSKGLGVLVWHAAATGEYVITSQQQIVFASSNLEQIYKQLDWLETCKNDALKKGTP